MARLVLTLEYKNYTHNILNKYNSYTSFKSSKDYLTVLKILIQCCDGFCPFSGVLYPDRKFGFEHFITRQKDDLTQDLNIDNLYPCCSDVNLSTKQNSLTLDPKLVDYKDRIYFDPSDMSMKPKNSGDEAAIASIEQYKLNGKRNQLSEFRTNRYIEIYELGRNFGSKYSFCEYF
jgi:hypothetical protein